MEHLPKRPTPETQINYTHTDAGQASLGSPVPQPEDANHPPEIKEETAPTGRRYRKSREESLERARWYMQNRRDYTINPPTEEELKRVQARMERARRLKDFLNPPTEGSSEDAQRK